MRYVILPILTVLTLLATQVGAAAEAPPVYVLAVANAESYDRDLPFLRYAHDDLARFVKVMTRTGMIPEDHVVALREATTAEVRDAFQTLARRAKPGGKFIFYYTGHSDATGLHLADGLLRKDELHALIRSVPADARIAFFDGCYSGALAAKGVKPAGDFVVPKAEFDEPAGSVFLAATSGTDVAFEVEELKGSLFTHELVDGLYGAADANHDGLVTIDELYQYVYRQMSASAAALPGARAQKPEYSVDLQGRGALVISYVGRTTAPLEIAADVAGDVQLGTDGGLQVFHVTKSPGAPLKVMLVPGDYAVAVRRGDYVGHATVQVKPDGTARLALADLAMTRAPNLDVVAKGQRQEARYGIAVGATSSSYGRLGPDAELELRTPAARIESSSWRLVGFAGGHENDLYYKRDNGAVQTGASQSLSVLTGAEGTFYTSFGLPGEQWKLLFGGGADYTWWHWDPSTDPDFRTFQPLVPKVAFGFGTSFVSDSGTAWGLSYRREFPFAKDQQTGDELAFGANVFAATLEW